MRSKSAGKSRRRVKCGGHVARREATPFRGVMGRFESFAGLLTLLAKATPSRERVNLLVNHLRRFPLLSGARRGANGGPQRRRAGRQAGRGRGPPARSRAGAANRARRRGGALRWSRGWRGVDWASIVAAGLGKARPDRGASDSPAAPFPPPPAARLGLGNLNRFRPGAAGSPPGPRSPRFGPGSPSPRWFWL